MVLPLTNYFLSGFHNNTHFEKLKAAYLFYIIKAALTFIIIIGIGQYILRMGPIYLFANIIALVGVSLSLVFFKLKRVSVAGHLMACSILIKIGVESILVDCFTTDLAMRYHLYTNFCSFLGLYFIILSFFREKKYVLWYAIGFEAILSVQAYVIYRQINYASHMGMSTIEHFLTISGAMVIIGAICTWLLSFMEALFHQNIEFAEQFKLQNMVLEKTVEDRTKALETSNKNLRDFAYIVSHDLKEPLRTISGFVVLIRKELVKLGLNKDQMEQYINYVTGGTQQMERLISDILTYSKLNNAEVQFEEVDMYELIEQVQSHLSKSIYESDAELCINDLLPLKGEKAMLGQLIENLISNAIKYRNKNRNPKITIGCTKEEGGVHYYVKDNGIGISENHFETIFKAFRRLHGKTSEYEGTGVGLAICKKVVDLHGGDIWVDSIEGEGSTFWFTLRGAQTKIQDTKQVIKPATFVPIAS